MQSLRELIGREHECDALNRALRDFAQRQRPQGYGAMLVTCADEAEREAAESFQHWFVDGLLPELKPWLRSPYRVANLGGRYEWGAVQLAEQHFATPPTRDGFKVVLIKINAHVAAAGDHRQACFGRLPRYEVDSLFCGAIHGLLAECAGPVYDDLREAFAMENRPRLEWLLDPQRAPLEQRALFAAVVSARLQARRAVVDIQEYTPLTPCRFVVVPCVTLNRKQRDSELLVGCYLGDDRDPKRFVYQGLGDAPDQYVLDVRHGRIAIGDPAVEQRREARDHREEILQHWMQRRQVVDLSDQRFQAVAQQVAAKKNIDAQAARELLKTLGWLLLELAPMPTAVMLFAKGVAGAHHLYKVHRLARGERDQAAAESIVLEFLGKLDQLSEEQTRRLLESLALHHAQRRHAGTPPPGKSG